ncbi:uncharacterized protein [Dermacentor andersoni]|uniref:uncharacterized protein n=1 Tax=Dermacentor andersoni TaxID=34620 RepID=UPI0024173E7B|nr:uncharacterized protein LOC126520414 [Dermacentor andersoni]
MQKLLHNHGALVLKQKTWACTPAAGHIVKPTSCRTTWEPLQLRLQLPLSRNVGHSSLNLATGHLVLVTRKLLSPRFLKMHKTALSKWCQMSSVGNLFLNMLF